jgi:hypothetical protein
MVANECAGYTESIRDHRSLLQPIDTVCSPYSRPEVAPTTSRYGVLSVFATIGRSYRFQIPRAERFGGGAGISL